MSRIGLEIGSILALEIGNAVMLLEDETGGVTADPEDPVSVLNVTPPLVTGTATIGSNLISTPGTWLGSPTSYTYQWRKNVVSIPGANSTGYTVLLADGGAGIDCLVTATNGTTTDFADSNDITIETPAGEEPEPGATRRRHRFKKVIGLHSGGTLVFNWTDQS